MLRAAAFAQWRLVRWRPLRSRRVPLAAAAFTGAASLTPSLLPKTVLVQGVVTGMAAAAGYAVGALIRWASAPAWQRVSAATRDRVAWALLGLALVSLVPAAWLAHGWQHELARSVGEPDEPPTSAVMALLLAAGVLAVTVLVADGLRVAIRTAAKRLSRLLPWWLAVALAVLVVGVLTASTATRIADVGLLGVVDRSFRSMNKDASLDLPPPSDPSRTGGPGSLVGWSTLGREGRRFISLPVPAQSSGPVRVYVGVDSAASVQARADLVVAELDRTGGWSRGVVCVVVPTGTGWIDPDAVTALEARWHGDSAVAAMQYSYLPSVLSLVSDQLRVDAAAQALLGAVVRRVQEMPERARPRLVLFGESLGSRGVETAMRDVAGAADMVSGVLLAGPPNANPMWSRLVANRDPGSPTLAPVVDGGRSVRFWPGAEMPEFDRTHDPWPRPTHGPRTLYLQHPSDPVVWWSPSLLWSQPEWARERTAVGNAPPLRWRPVVTFWQVSGDTPFAADVPEGHGHRYGSEMPAAWAAVAPLTDG